jgi:hypothetical protein
LQRRASRFCRAMTVPSFANQGNHDPRRRLEMRHLSPRRYRVMKTLIALTVAALALVSATSADAKGCIKGAVVGGVAGHYAGHHGVLGAAAGCLYGRHHAKEQAKQQQEQGTAPAGQTKM